MQILLGAMLIVAAHSALEDREIAFNAIRCHVTYVANNAATLLGVSVASLHVIDFQFV
jgi:hypothetical protein